jgi:DNA modification methylase
MSKEEVWRQESNSVEEAKTSNKSINFECSLCKTSANAPTETKRAELLLCKDCFGKKKDHRQNKLNDLTGSEWASLSKSVEQYNGRRTEKQRLHGAAFPASLVESQIKIYTKKGDLVLDPLLGVGTTIEVAESLKRKSIGLELSPEFATLALKDIKDQENHKVICDDVRNLKNRACKADCVTACFTNKESVAPQTRWRSGSLPVSSFESASSILRRQPALPNTRLSRLIRPLGKLFAFSPLF